MPLEPLLTMDDLAAYLGVSRRFIYRLTHERRIAYTRAGGQLRFSESAVAAYLAREENAAVPREEAQLAVARTQHRVMRPRSAASTVRLRPRDSEDEVRPSW